MIKKRVLTSHASPRESIGANPSALQLNLNTEDKDRII